MLLLNLLGLFEFYVFGIENIGNIGKMIIFIGIVIGIGIEIFDFLLGLEYLLCTIDERVFRIWHFSFGICIFSDIGFEIFGVLGIRNFGVVGVGMSIFGISSFISLIDLSIIGSSFSTYIFCLGILCALEFSVLGMGYLFLVFA